MTKNMRAKVQIDYRGYFYFLRFTFLAVGKVLTVWAVKKLLV